MIPAYRCRYVPVVIVLAATLLMSACSTEGEELTFEEAQSYFAGHESDLRRLIAALDACLPARAGTGYNRVWADGESSEGLKCTRGNPSGLQVILRGLNDANILAVSYSLGEGPSDSIETASFLLRRSGLGVSGSSTNVEYYTDPQPLGVLIEGGEDHGFSGERRALTAAPFHWFWQYSTS